MAMFENSTITNAGKALIDSWVSGETLTFTSAVTGSGYTDPAELKDLTVLPDVKQTKSIAAQESTAQGEKLTVDVDVVGLAAGYQLKQIGIYAQKGSDTPVLFAVFEDINGFYIHSETEMPDFVFEFVALLVMSIDGNVELKLDPTQLVTVAMLENYVRQKATFQITANESNAGVLSNISATPEEIVQAIEDKKTIVLRTYQNGDTFFYYAEKVELNGLVSLVLTFTSHSVESSGGTFKGQLRVVSTDLYSQTWQPVKVYSWAVSEV